MIGRRYFIINTYIVLTLENAIFNDIDKISHFQKWYIAFKINWGNEIFSYIL